MFFLAFIMHDQKGAPSTLRRWGMGPRGWGWGGGGGGGVGSCMISRSLIFQCIFYGNFSERKIMQLARGARTVYTEYSADVNG